MAITHSTVKAPGQRLFAAADWNVNHAGTLDHTTDLTNVGVNIHTQIDSHIASTANPHSVTASQVLSSYDTGWINRSDWTNVHMGSSVVKNADSNVTHNLNAPLSDILVKVLYSTDGTDANSFEMVDTRTTSSLKHGVVVFQVDSNNIKVQTATGGVLTILDNGLTYTINTDDWYYKIVVYKLT